MFVLRRPRKGETDGELLALAVIGLTAALGIAWLKLGWSTPGCLFHTMTGQPCLTCGGTRCLRDILAGQPLLAFEWNPLVFLGATATAIFVGYAVVVTTLRLPRVRVGTVSPPLALAIRLAIVGALAANWIYLVSRFSRGG